MAKVNERQFDIWSVCYDPEETFIALVEGLLMAREAQEKEEKRTIEWEPVELVCNCVSVFKIDGKEVSRPIDIFVCSRQFEMALCVANSEVIDEECGLVKTSPEDIMKFFEKYHIPYKVYSGIDPKRVNPEINSFDPLIPDIWMSRDDSVFNSFIDDIKTKGCKECIVYPETKASLSLRCYQNPFSPREIWGLNFSGLVEGSNTWALLVNENSDMNISIQQAEKMITDSGLSYKEDVDPMRNLYERAFERIRNESSETFSRHKF